jgi:hypothetical protein
MLNMYVGHCTGKHLPLDLLTGTIMISDVIPVHDVLSHLSSYFLIYKQQIMMKSPYNHYNARLL